MDRDWPKLSTAAIRHGENPYHFRGSRVNETTVISLFKKAGKGQFLGLPADFP